jgi:hypothetical protein
MITTDTLQIPNSIPKLSAYLRRKSESYVNRRRSDDYRSQQQKLNSEVPDTRVYSQRDQLNPPQVYIESVHEENEIQTGGALRQNLSRRELLRDDVDFL